MAISATTGSFGTVENWQGIPIYPHSEFAHLYGGDSVERHAQHIKADLVWSWIDAFVLPSAVCEKLEWAAWVPVDSDPLMFRNTEPLSKVRWAVGPTQFACNTLRKAGMKNVVYVPCSFDPTMYFPVDQKEARTKFGEVIKKDLTGKFLVNAVGLNVSTRKNYPAILDAWSQFQPKHPDAVLYLHTEVTGLAPGGLDLIQLAKLYGIDTDSILFVEQWHYRTGQIPGEYMNLLYNASDIHLNACYGEGFGLPIMEAQATGCPTIVPDFAAASEIGFGIKVNKGHKYPTVPGGFQFLVDHNALADSLEDAHDRKGDLGWREEIVEKAQAYRIDNVMKNHFLPALEKMEADIKEKPR